MATRARGLGRLLGGLALLALLAVVYGWFHAYDWGQPFAKLIGFAALFAIVVLAAEAVPRTHASARLAQLEVAVLALLLLVVVGQRTARYGRHFWKPPKVDVGATTQQAASAFFRDGENPYRNERIYVRPELAARYPGFHYGPVMFLGYAASAFSPGVGFKLTSLACLLGTLLALAALAARAGPGGLERAGAVLFLLAATLLPERLWWELLRQGAIDILPVFLLALALYLLDSGRWFAAGSLLGLSLSAKVSPALFLLVVLLRRDTRRELYAGLLLGVTPLVAFLLWDFRATVDGVFLLLLAVGYDSTSLYSITPPALHFLFPLAQLTAVAVTLARGFERRTEIESVLPSFLLLLIVAEVCHKEIHANHLVWFIPFLGGLLATRRLSMGSVAARIVGRAGRGEPAAAASPPEP